MEKSFQRALVEWEKTQSESSMREVLAQLFRHGSFQESQRVLIEEIFSTFLLMFLRTLRETLRGLAWTYSISSIEGHRIAVSFCKRPVRISFALSPAIDYSLSVGEPCFSPGFQGGNIFSYDTRIHDRWGGKPPMLFNPHAPVTLSELREALVGIEREYEGNDG